MHRGGWLGPVHVSFPKDVFSAEAEPPDRYEPVNVCVPLERPEPDPNRVERAAEMFLAAKKPILLAEGGVQWSDACEELRALAETAGSPVITTDSARGAVPEDHPLSFGVVGSLGNITAWKPCGARTWWWESGPGFPKFPPSSGPSSERASPSSRWT